MVRRLGGFAAALLVLGALGIVAILLAVYGVGCFQLRRPRQDPPIAVAAESASRSETVSGTALERAIEAPPSLTAEATSDSSRAAVENPPSVIVLAGTVVDVGLTTRDSRSPVANVVVFVQEGNTRRILDQGLLRTGADGTFRVEISDPGKRPLDVRLSVDGTEAVRNASARVKLEKGQVEASGLLLERFPLGDLIGTTVDPSDRPIPGVHVTAEGNPSRETDSDGDGRFRFANFAGAQFLDVSREGYLFLGAKNPVKIPEGGWQPLRIVLVPPAKLHVRVIDALKHGLAGIRVESVVSHWEKASPKAGITSQAEVVGVTGNDGRATLDVWTEQRLVIRMASEAHDNQSYEYEEDGVLRLEAREGARPIVLHQGEERELTAVFDPAALLRGRVVDESGQPVHPAFVTLESAGGVYGRDRLHLHHPCDDGGRFAFEIPADKKLTTVRLSASENEYDLPGGPATRIAMLDVGLPPDPSADLVLALHEGLRIAGHVLGPDGSRISAEIVAKRAGEMANVDPWGHVANAKRDGSFELKGLESGVYDISIRPRELYRDVELGSVKAGTDDLKIVLDARRPAHVTVEVQATTGTVAKWSLLNARIRPFPGPSPLAPALPAEAEYAKPGNLPRGFLGMFRGGGASSDEIGITNCSVVQQKNTSTQLNLDEGWYWFGARGTDADGRTLFPVGTGMVRIEAGDHKIRFLLGPAVPVDGRLVGSDLFNLHVGIARRGGYLFKLDVGGGDELRLSRPVGADGAFFFSAVPVGENELWIGTATELATAKPAQRQPLNVEAKGVPFLEIPVR